MNKQTHGTLMHRALIGDRVVIDTTDGIIELELKEANANEAMIRISAPRSTLITAKAREAKPEALPKE